MATRQEANRPQEQQGKQPEQPGRATREPATRPSDTSQPQESTGASPARREGAMAPMGGGWDQLSRLFDQFSRSWLGGGVQWGWGLDLREEGKEVVVRAEAPGFEPADFDVQVQGDQLILKAQHRDEREEKGGYRQWQRQDFYRSVTLPAEVDRDNVRATYRQGVLTVTLPKSRGGNGRRITVEG